VVVAALAGQGVRMVVGRGQEHLMGLKGGRGGGKVEQIGEEEGERGKTEWVCHFSFYGPVVRLSLAPCMPPYLSLRCHGHVHHGRGVEETKRLEGGRESKE